MPKRVIQEYIGQRAVEAFTEFAREDLDPPEVLEQSLFGFLKDVKLRQALALVLYGARWIYKLGLVSLARKEERAAHVRAQIVDYASICEALLSYSIGHAIDNGYVNGTAHRWANPDESNPAKRRPIKWGPASTESVLRKQNLWWYARIARENGIVAATLFDELDWLREQRNAIHIRQRVRIGTSAYLSESKKAFLVMNECVRQVRLWCVAHP